MSVRVSPGCGSTSYPSAAKSAAAKSSPRSVCSTIIGAMNKPWINARPKPSVGPSASPNPGAYKRAATRSIKSSRPAT